MNLRVTAAVAAVLAGLLWLGRWLTEGSLASSLHWAGLVVLAVSLAAAGASLVSSSAVGLRGLVAVAVPLLAWSVVSVVRPAGPALVDGALGLVAVVAGVAVLLRYRPVAPRRGAGRHAA